MRARNLLEHICTGMVHMGVRWCVHTGGFVVPWLTFRCQRGVRGGEFTGLTSPILLQCPSEDGLEGETKSEVGLGWGCGWEGRRMEHSIRAGAGWGPGSALFSC